MNDSTLRAIAIAELQRAIAILGGQTALAEALGRKQPLVWKWLNARKAIGVPPEHAKKIEELTHGEVKHYRLCPNKDIFPQAAKLYK